MSDQKVYDLRSERRRRIDRADLQPLHLGEHILSPTDWLVMNQFEMATLAMLFGKEETWKSLLALHLACCICTGKDFFGFPVKRGGVIYIAGEGHEGIKKRVLAWRKAHGLDPFRSAFHLTTREISLSDLSTLEDNLLAIKELYPEEPGEDGALALVVIDTWAQNFGPGDESSTADASAAVRAAHRIRAETGACVLIVHHSGHTDRTRARGSTVLPAAVSTVFRTEVDGSGVMRLTCEKMKDAPKPAPLAFQLREVEIEIPPPYPEWEIETFDIDPTPTTETSVVLEQVTHTPASKPGKAGRGKWQTTAISILADLRTDDRAEVPVGDWRRACLDAGMPQNRWPEVRRRLTEEGLVHIDNEIVVPE